MSSPSHQSKRHASSSDAQHCCEFQHRLAVALLPASRGRFSFKGLRFHAPISFRSPIFEKFTDGKPL